METMDELKRRCRNNLQVSIEQNPNDILTDKTKTIFIDESNRVDENEEILKNINISRKDFSTYPNWYFIDGKYYYFKRRSFLTSILNELLMEVISDCLELETIKPIIAVDKERIIGIASENFRIKGLDYIHSYDIPFYDKRKINKIIKSKRPDNVKLKTTLVKYIMRNIFTSLGDRRENTLFIKDDFYSLAPTFDNEDSFWSWDSSIYIDAFISDIFYRQISLDELSKLINEDTLYKELYDRLYSLDMIYVISETEKRHGIDIPNEALKYYLEFEELRKKYLTLSLNKKRCY